MHRRTLLALSPSALLFACAPGSQGAVTLATAKAYVGVLSNALAAAAAAYTGPQREQAAAIAAQLQVASGAFQMLGDVSTARSAALSITALAGQLVGILGSALPADVAIAVPIAVAVISAFVAALPAPSDAPSQPPAALERMAAQRR